MPLHSKRQQTKVEHECMLEGTGVSVSSSLLPRDLHIPGSIKSCHREGKKGASKSTSASSRIYPHSPSFSSLTLHSKIKRLHKSLHYFIQYSPLLALLILALAFALLGHGSRHEGEAALSHNVHLVTHRVLGLRRRKG